MLPLPATVTTASFLSLGTIMVDLGVPKKAWEEWSLALRLWYGENYGFTESEEFVTIANTCFEDKDR
jgi:hypothetical protein